MGHQHNTHVALWLYVLATTVTGRVSLPSRVLTAPDSAVKAPVPPTTATTGMPAYLRDADTLGLASVLRHHRSDDWAVHLRTMPVLDAGAGAGAAAAVGCKTR